MYHFFLSISCIGLLLSPFQSYAQDTPFANEDDKIATFEKLFDGKWNKEYELILWEPNFGESSFFEPSMDHKCHTKPIKTLEYKTKTTQYHIIIFGSYVPENNFRGAVVQLSIAQYSKPIPNPTDAKATSPKWELTAFSKYVTSYSYYGRFPELDILTVGKYNFIRLFGKWGTTAGEGRYEILFQANFNNHFIPRFEYHTYEKTLIGTSCDESSQSKTTMSIDHKNNQFTLTTTGTKLFFDREGPTKRIDASDAKVYKVVVRHKVERID